MQKNVRLIYFRMDISDTVSVMFSTVILPKDMDKESVLLPVLQARYEWLADQSP